MPSNAGRGVVLADMALAGELSIHDCLEEFLPGAENYPASIRGITLAQLATHSSGLPRLPGNLGFGMKDPSNPYAHYGAKQLQAGTTHEALLKTRVMEPLGMKDTSIALSPDQKRSLAPGHAGGKAVSNWDIDALAGAGAVRSTAADMAKPLDALMHPPASRLGKAMALATELRGDLGAAKVGFAWLTSTPPGGKPFIWHNGGTGGYRSFIGFTKDRSDLALRRHLRPVARRRREAAHRHLSARSGCEPEGPPGDVRPLDSGRRRARRDEGHAGRDRA